MRELNLRLKIKLFSLLAIYAKCFLDTRTRSKITNHDLSSDMEIFFNFLKKFILKYWSNECRNLLESFTKRELSFHGNLTNGLLNTLSEFDEIFTICLYHWEMKIRKISAFLTKKKKENLRGFEIWSLEILTYFGPEIIF